MLILETYVCQDLRLVVFIVRLVLARMTAVLLWKLHRQIHKLLTCTACHELLTALMNCTYLIESQTALEVLYTSLQQSFSALLPFIPSQSAIPLNTAHNICKHLKRRHEKHTSVEKTDCVRTDTHGNNTSPKLLEPPLPKNKTGS